MENSKFYLTKEGLVNTEKEYQKLLGFKKLKTKGEVPAIWHSEDVNPEYLSFQEDMSLLEARIAEYEEILRSVVLIRAPSGEKKKEVCLGATVTLQEAGGQINEYIILGTLEANPTEGKISSDSPVGKALLGKKVKEEVVINSPIRIVYKVKSITY